jgi:polyphosphate kinase 2 (PPK2 family)
LKKWKISPVDDAATKLWKDYSEARDEMLLRTNFPHAPWFIVSADDKDETHIALITHLLSRLDYKHKDEKALLHATDLVFAASPENIKERLF